MSRNSLGHFVKGNIPPIHKESCNCFRCVPAIGNQNGIKFKKGHKINLGRIITDEHRKKLSDAKIGKKPNNFGKPQSEETRRKQSLSLKGSKSYLWKGGITNENRAIRSSVDYKLWREKVFKRDNYTCQDCNERGVHLQADHIKQFAFYPELRFKLSNGRTLCKSCHKKTDTYAKRTK